MPILLKIYVTIFKILRRLARGWMFGGITSVRYCEPRHYSNDMLHIICPLFPGHIINVSGWKDSDREGGFYKDYFKNAESYTVSNYGEKGIKNELGNSDCLINLEEKLSIKLLNKYDVVFNHTTIEHVYDVFTAMKNMCDMSTDIIIIIVPFSQKTHCGDGYFDYWRLTPYCVKRLFKDNNVELIASVANDDQNFGSVYGIFIGSKKPEKWIEKIDKLNLETNMDFML